MPLKNRKFFLLLVALYTLCHDHSTFAWGSNARNDPFPMYTSMDPQTFVYRRERQLMKGFPDEKGTPEWVTVSLSAFGQNADKAKTISATYKVPKTTGSGTDAEPAPTPSTCNVVQYPGPCSQIQFPSGSCFNTVEIGDIDGLWDLLALLAGPIPEGRTYPETLVPALNVFFPGTQPGQLTTDIYCNALSDKTVDQDFAKLSVPLKYRKRGIRWDVEAQLCGGFGLQFQGGFVEISQVLNCRFNDLTPANGNDPFTQSNETKYLSCELPKIAENINFNICNFTKWGVEDLYFCLYWRQAFKVNLNRDLSWARFLAIPFFRIGGSAATGKPKEPCVAFSLPFGNNGHNSADANIGINLDFVETVEIGGEIGVSHFFPRDICGYRLPNFEKQSGIFPYSTTVRMSPGDTYYFAAKLAAYQFLDRLSFWAQWVFVHHREDHIREIGCPTACTETDGNCCLTPYCDAKLKVCDQAFLTPKCPNSVWRTQFANIAFTYDFSPSVGMGLLWQQPLHVRNAYNSTTILFSLNFTF